MAAITYHNPVKGPTKGTKYGLRVCGVLLAVLLVSTAFLDVAPGTPFARTLDLVFGLCFAIGPSIERASANAKAAGVADRVSFRQLDASKGLPQQHDVITTFDVIHDAANPLGLLRAIRQALPRDGVYVCLDINCSHKLEENIGPLGALFHGFSVLYCMTTSLGAGGVGLGTLGFHEPKVREMCSEAGFSTVRRVPLENPFNNLYEVAP